MLNFLKKKMVHQPDVALELISIHIPKTAGTSFRNTLKQVYGEDRVARLDISRKANNILLNEVPYTGAALPPSCQVVHGHFTMEKLYDCFPVDPNIPIITWLRHPVERVISNYFYLSKRLAEELDEKAKGLNILDKLQRSLIEYARNKRSQNRMCKFLKGTQISDLAFVGIQEYYDSDLADLARILGWQELPSFKDNVTGGNYQVDTATRDEIASLNLLDMELYHTALEMRKKRLANNTHS